MKEFTNKIPHQKTNSSDTEGETLFQNKFLELLSKSNPTMMAFFHIGLAASILYIGHALYPDTSSTVVVSFFLFGVLSWTLAEYLMHRFLFHLELPTKFMNTFHYLVHGYHHKAPSDKQHLFMPPIAAFLFLLVFFGLFYSILNKYTWYYLPGFEMGYFIYANIHFQIHRKVPTNKYLNKLWHHHASHHYREEKRAFGVSTVFWDKVFGTMPTKELQPSNNTGFNSKV